MYFKQIDSFRFFAVFLVLISHWLYEIPFIERLRLGAIGVDFFLVISGFLISLQLYGYKDIIDNKIETFQKALYVFYVRRILRIFPLYYFVVILTAIFNKGEIREAVIWNLTFTSNLYLIKVQHWPSIFSHFWSLSVEEHFYLFWPFIVLLCNRKFFFYIFSIVIIFSVLFRYWTFSNGHDYFKVYVHTFSCLDLFMMGALLAYVYRYKNQLFNEWFSSYWIKFFTVVSFAFLYSISLFKPDWQIFNWAYLRLFLGFIYLLILGFVVLSFRSVTGAFFLENRILQRLGKMSYGIYLIHNFVPGLLLPIKKLGLNYMLEFSIYLVVTIIISEVLYGFIEKPARRFNKSFYINTERVT